MTPELKNAFEEAKRIIFEKKEILVDALPVVHELDDGIVIKFFTDWEDVNTTKIKLRKISSLDDPDERVYLGFVPKGVKINARSNLFMECLILLDGELIIDIEGDIKNMTSYTKICIDANSKYNGEAIKDSYFILIGCYNCDK